ncbi:hypothetical protein [Flavobacterium cellulosilyticum]|uniref:Uncharacterized protein n=1 Tax=Flavobacterium cellulosilyticum TaxID=2541731 RepID=A0A4R5CHN1_9FLAO|nr:hypothetical protein [Flavobacterium cellulosilyticum]TDD98030.1 hypothetical protein E0F76_08010 [Flavobacterium cellulosilyticum]
MKTVVVRHKVKDFDVWKKGQQERLEIFAPAINSFNAFQDVDNPNSVVIIIETDNVELLGAIINDPKNQHLKDKHTVLEPITMSMQIQF